MSGNFVLLEQTIFQQLTAALSISHRESFISLFNLLGPNGFFGHLHRQIQQPKFSAIRDWSIAGHLSPSLFSVQAKSTISFPNMSLSWRS